MRGVRGRTQRSATRIRNVGFAPLRVVLAFGILTVIAAGCLTSSAPKAVPATHATATTQTTALHSVTPDVVGHAALPSAPQNVMALAIGPGVMVVWSPPPSNGGVPITKYEVIPSSGAAVVVGGSGTTATFTGLPRGAIYTFTVKATNASGTGPSSLPSAAVQL
jgi:hypothetical protein